MTLIDYAQRNNSLSKYMPTWVFEVLRVSKKNKCRQHARFAFQPTNQSVSQKSVSVRPTPSREPAW